MIEGQTMGIVGLGPRPGQSVARKAHGFDTARPIAYDDLPLPPEIAEVQVQPVEPRRPRAGRVGSLFPSMNLNCKDNHRYVQQGRLQKR
ncbi:MAG: hypothetical protein ACLTSG_06615 [Lachnospiraceae bacterium]